MHYYFASKTSGVAWLDIDPFGLADGKKSGSADCEGPLALAPPHNTTETDDGRGGGIRWRTNKSCDGGESRPVGRRGGRGGGTDGKTAWEGQGGRQTHVARDIGGYAAAEGIKEGRKEKEGEEDEGAFGCMAKRRA